VFLGKVGPARRGVVGECFLQLRLVGEIAQIGDDRLKGLRHDPRAELDVVPTVDQGISLGSLYSFE